MTNENKYKILVIEDDEGISHLAKKSLERNGYQADCATDGAEALNHIQKESYDLLLLDFALPDMKADELLLLLDEAGKDIPFIITTGHGCEKIAVDFMKKGAKDYIVKDDNFWDFLTTSVERFFSQVHTEKKLKTAESSLEEKSILNQMILDALPFETILINRSKQVVECNKFAEENNIKPGENFCICGKDNCIIDKLFADKSQYAIEMEISGKMHEIHWVPLNNNLCLCYLLNIDDRINAEHERRNLTKQLQQAQKMEAIGQMTGCIAHDFNNLLSGIIGYSELSQNISEEDTKANKYINIINETANRASEMTNKLLTFSRKKSDGFKNLNLKKILTSTLDLFEHSCKGIELDVDIIDCNFTVKGNEEQLQNSLLNILINSKDAIGKENGEISVKTRSVTLDDSFIANILNIPEGGDFIELMISDNGSGMDEDTLSRIFEPFFTTKKSKGTGLGLSSTYGHIRSHKGAIHVDSEIEKGSTFYIYLPAAKSEALSEKQNKKNNVLKNKTSKDVAVLSPDNTASEIMKLLLAEIDNNVSVFNTAKSFISYIEEQEELPQVIVLDFDYVSESYPDILTDITDKVANTEIIALAHNPEDFDKATLEKNGVNDIMAKPFSLAEYENITCTFKD